MLEFDIDKQAGSIQLHSCQRKSRWCRFLLRTSWLLMLAFLGWLFWKGMPGGALALSPLQAPASQTSVIQQYTDKCETINETVNKETDNKSLAAKNEESCTQRLLELEKKLKLELGNQYKKQLEQQKKQSAEKLKASQLALQKLNKKISIIEKNNPASQLPNKDKSNPDLAKRLFYYEKILGSNGVEDAIFINSFAAQALQEKHRYRFQLILGRLGQPAKTMGDFEIFLKGNKIIEAKETEKLADGAIREKTVVKKEPVTYKHTDLLPPEAVSGQNNFAFKYYLSQLYSV